MARPTRPRELLPSPSDDPETRLEGLLRAHLARTPWWVISAVFHAGLLGLLATVTFASRSAFAEGALVVLLPPAEAPRRLCATERLRDVVVQEALPLDAVPSDEPALFFAEAELADTNTTANDVDLREFRGVSEAFRGALGESPGVKGRALVGPAARSAALGVGGGSGTSGCFSRGRGDRVNRRKSSGCTALTESAVEAGLRWLARHQDLQGGWSCAGFGAECAGGPCSGGGDPQHDVGVSGLSLLAFLGAGYTPLTRTTYVDLHSKQRLGFGRTVKRGLDWLLRRQTADGCVGPKHGHYLYDHAIAALALAEAYGLTSSPAYRGPAQRAIDFLVEARNPALAWRYEARSGDDDTSVTGWVVMALKSAHTAGLYVPRAAYDGARTWLDRVTDEAGRVGYTSRGSADVFVPGRNEAWRPHPAMTAVGLLLRIYIDEDRRDPLLGKSAGHLAADLPRWDEAGHQVDSYYWYYGTLALFQYQDGGGQAEWKAWNAAMKTALVPSQRTRKDGCADGSWSPEVDRWGAQGGRICTTALNVMSLEVYYRYRRVFAE